MYPKWIQRSKDLGPALATNEDEEKAIVAHWKAQEKSLKKQAETKAEAEAAAGEQPVAE